MSLFRFFTRAAGNSSASSAPAARERLQVLLAHERSSSSGKSDLVNVLRDEIMAVIAKHMQIDSEKVSVKLERGDKVSTLAVDVEIPFDAAKTKKKAA